MSGNRNFFGRVPARRGIGVGLVALACLSLLGGGFVASAAHNRTRQNRTVARKLREARAYARTHRKRHARKVAAGTKTYRGEGVSMAPVVAKAAAADPTAGGMSASQAVASFRQQQAAIGLLGGTSAMATASPTASLEMVTEEHPTYQGQSPGTDESWVVTVNNAPGVQFGGNSGPSDPGGAVCQDVAIYDLSLSAWTDLFQTCSPKP